MKNFLIIIAITFFTYSCGGNRSNAIDPTPIIVKVQIIKIDEKVKESDQVFIDAAVKAILELDSNPTSNYDFEKLNLLLEKATSNINQAILELNNIVDNEISENYKNSYKSVLFARKELFLEFAKWIDLVQKDRQSSNLEQIRNTVFEKANTLNEKQIQFSKSQSEFNKKYKL